ncbi:MAG: methyl-accepting chemotaxis protein [Nevskia sp.]
MSEFLKSMRLTSKLVVMISLATVLIGLATAQYVGQVNLALAAVNAEQAGIAPALVALDAGGVQGTAEARIEWRDSLTRIADESTLSLDPEAGTYHLMSASMLEAPTLIAVLGDARQGAASGVAAAVLADRLATNTRGVDESLRKAIAAEPVFRDTLGETLTTADTATRAAIAELALPAASAGREQIMLQAEQAQVALAKASVALIGDALEARGSALLASRLQMLLLVGFGLIGFAALAVWIVRGVNAEHAAERERANRETERAEAIKHEADSNRRILNALDNVTTNVMIADADRTIVYVNRSVQEMLIAAESDIRRDLPNFDARKLVGTSIDSLHKNPAHQSQMLERMSSTMRAGIKVGGRSFALTVNPIVGDNGARLGAVVEWLDRTIEVATEAEVSRIVEAAGHGDFTQRISLEGKVGYFGTLAKSINQLLETSSVGLGEVVRVLGALAKGDLTETISNDYQGTFGQLKADSNATVQQLASIVSSIKSATDTINVAASEIAAGNQDLSSRTEQQAASLEETASSMEELTSTVKQNAENARQANQLAIGASEVAVKGGTVVSDVVNTMDAINDSSKKIVDIISVIDGIAFQTNILALNAAVEAARAGEQGRGFAVVAAEVRSLAQRSATAAKEIKVLIGDSVEKVGNGTKLVEQAGRTMNEIVTSVKRVTDIMSEITAASEEQSSGIEQINQAITQMDEVTQQNAALVEEASAAARSMEQQASGLAGTVAFFVLSATQRGQGEAEGAAAGGRVLPMPVRAAAPRGGHAAAAPRRASAEATAKAADQWTEF